MKPLQLPAPCLLEYYYDIIIKKLVKPEKINLIKNTFDSIEYSPILILAEITNRFKQLKIILIL